MTDCDIAKALLIALPLMAGGVPIILDWWIGR